MSDTRAWVSTQARPCADARRSAATPVARRPLVPTDHRIALELDRIVIASGHRQRGYQEVGRLGEVGSGKLVSLLVTDLSAWP